MSFITFPTGTSATELVDRMTAPLVSPALLLRPGGILMLKVQSILGPNEFLLKAGDQSFAARFAGPLEVGQKITVQVLEVGRPVVLKLLSFGNPLQEQVTNWRLNPQALFNSFSQAAEMMALVKKVEVPPGLASLWQAEAANALAGLLLSSKTAGNSYLIHLVRNLGLTWERDLSRRLSQSRLPLSGPYPLKPFLMQLQHDLADFLGKTNLAGEEGQTLLQGERFFKAFLANIEALQAVNVQSWEEEGKFILQFPLQLGEKLGLGEMLIEREPGRKNVAEKDKWRFFFYVNFDLIGEVTVEMKTHGSRLAITIQAGREDTVNLVSSHLAELTGALALLGYQVDSLACNRGEDLRCLRDRHFAALKINQADLLNVIA
jgi:hypothetical protein